MSTKVVLSNRQRVLKLIVFTGWALLYALAAFYSFKIFKGSMLQWFENEYTQVDLFMLWFCAFLAPLALFGFIHFILTIFNIIEDENKLSQFIGMYIWISIAISIIILPILGLYTLKLIFDTIPAVSSFFQHL